MVDTASAAARSAFSDAERAMALGDGRDLPAVVESGAYRFFAGDYDGAVERLDQADALADSSPEVAVLRAAAELARGDGAGVQASVDEALARLDTMQASAENRAVAADLFTLLEWVRAHEPERADGADALKDQLAAGETALVVGRELSGEVPEGAAVAVDELAVDGDERSLTLSHEGLPDDTAVSVYLYEQPADGASFVQAAEMARFGLLSESGSISGTATLTRACAPVALRLDVYLDGAPAGSFDAPGGPATC